MFAPTRFYDRAEPIPLVLTKSGELQAWLRLEGIDPECKTDEEIETAHSQLASEIHSLPESYRLFQYLAKTDGAALPEVPTYSNAIVTDTERRRLDFLRSLKLATISPYLVICDEPQHSMFGGNTNLLRLSRKKIEEKRRLLLGSVSALQQGIDGIVETSVMSKHEIFWFLRFLQSLDPEVASAAPLVFEDGLDHWMSSTAPQLFRSGIALGRPHVRVMTMRRPPKRTWPAILRGLLSIDCNILVCTEFQRQPIAKIEKTINDSQRHFSESKWVKDIHSAISIAFSGGKKDHVVPDKAVAADIEELGETLKLIKNGNESMGLFSAHVLLFDENSKRVDAAMSQASRVFVQHDGLLEQETFFAFGAYAATIPGTTPKWGNKLRQRGDWLRGSQYVDLSLFYTHSTGDKVNHHLQREPLAWLTTADNTLYGFNLHEEDLLGAMVLGRQGSGKSVFVNACVDLLMKYSPWVLILDGLGGSYKQLIQKHGGNYFELNAPEADKGWPFTLNPFQLSPSRRTFQHLSMLWRMCMISGGYRPTAKRNQLLWDGIRRVFDLPLSRRRLGNIELPDDMMPYLAPWIGDGQYGYVFDNDDDSFSMSRPQTAIDFSELGGYPEVLAPMTWHFFYLWNNVIYNPALLTVPKLMVGEEIWVSIRKGALQKPIRRYIETAARTWRKRNGGIMLVGQSLVEYEQADMLDLMNELCPTKALMYSPGADFDHYAKELKLNEAEKQQWISLQGKGDLFLKTNRRSKKLKLPLDPLMLAMARNDPFGNQKRAELQERFGFERGLQEFALLQESGALAK